MKKNRILLLFIAAMLLFSAAVMAELRATGIIKRARASLAHDKTATFNVSAKEKCESIGIVRYTLYRSNGRPAKSEKIESYAKNSIKHSTTVDLSSYIKDGESYYVIAYFYADGETYTALSHVKAY